MARIWDAFTTERDRLVFEAAGYGRRIGFGSRPALFVIDVQYNFVGDTPEPILQSIRKYRTSCGLEGWDCVHRIQELLQEARAQNLPVFYTVSERRADLLDSGIQVGKSHRGTEKTSVVGSRATLTVEEVAPRPEDILISKRKPSAFFGTPLMSHLNFLDVDTLIVTGCTTSGCVRATAVDAYAYNFRTVVVEDCVFDRFQSSHAIALWDLNAKYADVLPMEEVKAYLQSLPTRDTPRQLP
jgi:nicotinamidase-related amidase